jgi:hypothetical protein
LGPFALVVLAFSARDDWHDNQHAKCENVSAEPGNHYIRNRSTGYGRQELGDVVFETAKILNPNGLNLHR